MSIGGALGAITAGIVTVKVFKKIKPKPIYKRKSKKKKKK